MFRTIRTAALFALTLATTGAIATPTPAAAPRAGTLAATDAPAALAYPSLGHWTSGPAGFDTRSHWLDTGAEVVVFGAQFTPELAQALLAEIRRTTASPVRWVVVLHPNPDKFNGAAVFQAEGAKVVASAATAAALPAVHAYKKYYFVHVAKQFTDETYPAQATVDVTFEGSFDLPLAGGAVVSLRTLEHSGVASDQTVAYVPSRSTLVVGDLVHHQAHAWLEGGLVDGVPAPDLRAWRQALDELAKYPATTVGRGGRGEAAVLGDAVASQQEYLSTVERLVRAYLVELGERRHELRGPAAGEHFAELARRAAAQYPERALPYLVEYGVYGLALALLGE